MIEQIGADSESHFVPYLPIIDGPWNEDVWLAEQPVRMVTSGSAVCAVETCSRDAGKAEGEPSRTTDVLCLSHRRRHMKEKNVESLETFILAQSLARPIGLARGASTRKPHHPAVDFRRVSPNLAHQLRYVISIKINRNHWRDPRYVVLILRDIMSLAEEYDLTDLSQIPGALCQLNEEPRRSNLSDKMAGVRSGNLHYALPGMIELLETARSDPWDADVWHPYDLKIRQGGAAAVATVQWIGITSPWIRDGLKRLCREYLQSGTHAWSTILTYVAAGRSFCRFMDSETGPLEPQDLTRQVFLDFASWLRDENDAVFNVQSANTMNRLLTDMRDRELIVGLPDRPLLKRGDNPTTRTLRPKPFPDDILERIDELLKGNPGLPDDVHLMLRLFRAIGPRACELLDMKTDVITFQEGRGYTLSYFQTKTDSWRTIPIYPLLGEDLVAQRNRVEALHGASCPYLFPYRGPGSRANTLVGTRLKFSPWPYNRFSSIVWAKYQDLGIVKSSQTGESLTGAQLHRFRHSIATELLSEDWTQYEVQKFLGQRTPTMMQAYAEIKDDKLRDKYIEYMDHSVGINGGKLEPVGQAEIDVERLRSAMVRSTLANGFCSLPEKLNCEFLPNPCLSCTFFRTTPTFLPIHIRQRDDSLRELDVSRVDGRERATQILEKTVATLDTIIVSLQNEVSGTVE